MLLDTFHKSGVSATVVERKNERLALLILSIQNSSKWNPHEEALHMIYTEALLAGAGKYDRKSFIDTLSSYGISLQASYTEGVLSITLSAIDTTITTGLRLFELMCTAPNFSQSELRRIKTYVRNTLILAREDARMRAYGQFSNSFTNPQSPDYLHDLSLIEKEVQKVTVSELQALHTRYMCSPWTTTFGGNKLITEKILESVYRLRKKYSAVEQTKETILGTPAVQQEAVLLLDIPSKHNIEFSIGAPLPITRTDSSFPATVFALSVLGLYGGFTGRLMSIVREKEGLTYSIYAQAERSTHVRTGFWRIMTFFNPKDTIQGIKSTLREIDRLHREGITKEELNRFRAILHTRQAMIEDSLQKKVREVHGYVLAGYTLNTYNAYKKQLLSVTQKEVNDAIRQYIKTDQILISGAGPVESVRKELAQFNGA